MNSYAELRWFTGVLALLAAGCASTHGDDLCARYERLLPALSCTDPEVWQGDRCPSDAELEARGTDITTLEECVELMESLCPMEPNCLDEEHDVCPAPECLCTVPLGERRSACAPAGD